MSLPTPIPLVLLGQRVEIGKPVSELLQPEYEGVFSTVAISYETKLTASSVIYFIQSVETAQSELPKLLTGKEPTPATNDVGTGNFTQRPRIVMFGRGYTPETVEELKKSLTDVVKEPVAWVVGDPAKAPTGPPGPGYIEEVTNDVKAAVATWVEEGGTQDAFIVY
ncbi:hypothetical protein BJX63DRAFT_410940 [Aspergillus granulosus]|uniref:Uncharacterized protein n=1 Tax=Aspergillus granulosus TaxID=176169 RepID=A0ABR4GXG8_9EURO